jgi:uncharacterized protein YndB with AHSA1/START domain
MNTEEKTKIVVQTTIKAEIEKVWEFWTSPEHITKWNAANDEWHTPHAENDMRVGGKFLSRMESKDGSMGFDFEGVYETVKPRELIEYILGDSRKVKIEFISSENVTKVIETFETESVYSIELQQAGWQAILDNFKKYSEAYK